MLRPKIGLDWDDVTAPFNSIAIAMANEKYHIDPPLRLEEIDTWENRGRTGIIREFYEDEELYARQQVPEKNKKAVYRLMEIADVYFITAVAPAFMGIRAKQILTAFPEFPPENIILGNAKNLVQFDIILDDAIHNVLETPATYPVLMRKPWNWKMTGLLSVNQMSEFVSLVRQIIHASQTRTMEIKNPSVLALVGPSGSGKSTLLNIIANCLQLKGKEYATSNSFGSVDYCGLFSSECLYTLGEDDYGNTIKKLPENSRYIKSEDILYEIKKIQQKQILSDGMEYDYVKRGMSLLEAKTFLTSKEGRKQEEYIKFAQEKYSNGETSMQYFEEYLQPDALYLLDEPEVSLSPANQVILAEEINKMARLLECQFIIATHSPFMLGTLNAKIYNLDTEEYDVTKWSDLDNVRYFYNFFKKHEDEFKEDYL